ncbi:MAG: hypothetical protein HAW64_04075 [Alphaproteobacteria bacterium]|nr:hypothetical protein [Alphaproteobacteria bacterium]
MANKWDEYSKTKICNKCGAKYEVKFQKVPWRDEDKFECECGEVFKYKGTHAYMSHKKIES